MERKLDGPPASGGRLLREARAQLGLTLADISEDVGCDAGTVWRWENKDITPRRKYRRPLAEVLRIPYEDLCLALGVPSHTIPPDLRDNVVPMRTEAQVSIHDADGAIPVRPVPSSEAKREFLSAILTGLSAGYATSNNWLAAAQATARSLGIDWMLTQPESTERPSD